jgi:predicted nucleic acid-binding protein
VETLVLDASVVAKWYIDEADSGKALQIRDLHLNRKKTLSLPVLIIYEIANVLAKHPSFTAKDAGKAFRSLLGMGLNLRSFAEPDLLERTFETSKQLRVTFYDAAYVALAKQYNTILITADKDLHGRINRYCKTRLLSETKPDELRRIKSAPEESDPARKMLETR